MYPGLSVLPIVSSTIALMSEPPIQGFQRTSMPRWDTYQTHTSTSSQGSLEKVGTLSLRQARLFDSFEL